MSLAPMAAAAKTAQIDRIPDPDYETHPAYGKAFPRRPLKKRLAALQRFLPWFALVACKKVLRFDRLPVPSDYAGPMGGGLLGRLSLVPRYAPLVIAGWAAAVREAINPPRVDVDGPGKSMLEVLRRDGISPARMDDHEMSELRNLVQPWLAELRRRRETAQQLTFEGNQIWINAASAPELYSGLQRILARHGALAAAGAYLGRKISIKHLTLQLNDSRDAYHHHKFADVCLEDPPTNYMHIDTTYEMLKCMIYLNDVGRRNGPFSYVRGSGQLKIGAFEGLVRRSVDRAGFSGYSRETRELFMSLPSALRKKCMFGSDLRTGSPEAEALVAAEYQFVSTDGNMALFDNLGIHRGALVQEGARQVLIANLA